MFTWATRLAEWWAGKPVKERSKDWPRVRAEHLKHHPTCAACGGKKSLEVHHILPFHAFPALELSPDNLLTLCEASGRNCHFCFGHAYSWKGWVATVCEDAARFRKCVEVSQRLAKEGI